jgi:uridine phosphorylase
MPFPNFRNKHSHKALISPRDYIAYARKRGLVPKGAMPKGLIIAYHRTLMEYVLKHHPTQRVKGFFGEMFLLRETKNRVAIIGNFGIGAPGAVIHLEEFIECGVKRFVSVGTAGALQKGLEAGDLVLCERAIRDEGSSHHYLAPLKYAYPSPTLTDRLRDALRSRRMKFASGTSWSIDSPYRETVSEARRYQRQGVLAVEMEAAALFAVAKYRKADVAALFSISDSLADFTWKPAFHLRKNQAGLEKVFRVAVEALSTPFHEFVPGFSRSSRASADGGLCPAASGQYRSTGSVAPVGCARRRSPGCAGGRGRYSRSRWA